MINQMMTSEIKKKIKAHSVKILILTLRFRQIADETLSSLPTLLQFSIKENKLLVISQRLDESSFHISRIQSCHDHGLSILQTLQMNLNKTVSKRGYLFLLLLCFFSFSPKLFRHQSLPIPHCFKEFGRRYRASRKI